MNRSRQFRILPVILGLAMVSLAHAGAASEDAGGPTLPKDPCALLKPAEIQAALVPNAAVSRGVPTTNTAPLAVSCSYTWGPRTSQWGESSVTVMVIDASQAYPGMSADQIRQGVADQGRRPTRKCSPETRAGRGSHDRQRSSRR
jgi:hypothetical protein